MNIKNWCNRMEKLVQMTDRQFVSLSKKVIEKCPYGEMYFCDGSINKTIRNRTKENRPRCKYFKDGECELLIHIS